MNSSLLLELKTNGREIMNHSNVGWLLMVTTLSDFAVMIIRNF
jgi:hypothetical protein